MAARAVFCSTDGARAPSTGREWPVLSTAEPGLGTALSVDRFEDLFTRLYGPLFGLTFRVLGNSAEAEETLQEAFLRLSGSAVLDRPDEEVAAWLRRVCLNLGFNRLRERRHARERLERVGRLEPPDGRGDADPARAVIRSEEQAAVRAALATLPERQRDCLILRHSGHSYAEIAATLGIAVGSVGVILARGERAFRETYQEHSHDLS
jgi:RNA polymerase sigma-70 factor (ECF subfamily)